jgi:hypothetical protein
MNNNLSSLLTLARVDVSGAFLLAKQANLVAELMETLPTELAYKLNPNLR